MKCVHCNQSMLTAELSGVEIDYCAVCGGVWLDREELALLLGDSAKARSFLESLAEDPAVRENRHACPVCRHIMRKVRFGRAGAPVIDECAADGLWCDRGELESLLKMDDTLGDCAKMLDLLKGIFKRS